MKQMNHQLNIFKHTSSLKNFFENKKTSLAEKREQLKLLKEQLKTEMHTLSRKNTTLERKIKSSDVFNILNDLEQKVRVYEQNIFLLSDYITQKGSESDYSSLKSETLDVLNQLITQKPNDQETNV
jgi:hypothetical protein